MRRILKLRPSPSMVVAFIALLLALGSGAYAQLNIPNNSVGTKKLKNNAVTTNKINNGAVTTQKIRNGAVNSNKVRNGSLLSADFAAGQLPAGPRGPEGERGPAGPAGAPGPAGATNVTFVATVAELNPVATCPPGRVAIAGGGSVTDPTWYLYASRPVGVPGGPPTGWSVQAADTGPPAGPAQPATAYVVCAAP